SPAAFDRPLARLRRALARNASRPVRSSRRGALAGSRATLPGWVRAVVDGPSDGRPGAAGLGPHVVETAGDATTLGGAQPDRPLRRVRRPCCGLAVAGRRLSAAVPLSPSIDQPARILGAKVEPGVLRDDGDRDLSTSCPRRRPRARARCVVPGIRPASRTGDQRTRSGRLWPPNDLLHAP